MRLTANKIAGILRDRGYKLTPQRHALLKVIATQHDHLSSQEILEKTRQEYPGIGRVTVFRTLDLLNKLNLLCRFHAQDGCHSYMMRRPTEHHHHLVCSNCGQVIDFTECELDALVNKLSSHTGFNIEEHLLELWGRCRDCLKTGEKQK